MEKFIIKEYWDLFATNDFIKTKFQNTKFQGYHQLKGKGKILQLWDKNGKLTETLTGIGFVLFDETVFYAEGGGQPSDYGWLLLSNNQEPIEVMDLNKKILDHCYIHLVNTNGLTIKINDILIQEVEPNRRKILTQNHSGQHLFCDALNILANKILPEHSIGIKLEYFTSEFYNDDFFTIENILKARDLTRSWIAKAIPSKEVYMDLETARSKNIITREYDFSDYVRVVEFENTCADLCGGTHIDNTNELSCLEIMDISITKKYVSIKATTNYEACLAFFQTEYERLKLIAEKCLEKIANCQQSSDLKLDAIIIPKNYEDLQRLKTIVEEFHKTAQEIEKQYKKNLQLVIANYQFEDKQENLQKALWITYAIKEQNLAPDLFRGRILSELKGTSQKIIYCYNKNKSNYALIAASFNLQGIINLKTEFENFHWTTLINGGGNSLILELIADFSEIKLFINVLKEKINN